jgi:hypothetical protein
LKASIFIYEYLTWLERWVRWGPRMKQNKFFDLEFEETVSFEPVIVAAVD